MSAGQHNNPAVLHPSSLKADTRGEGSPRTALRFLAANVSYWMVAGAYSPFLSSYFTSIGLSATQIGTLLIIQPVAVIAIQPLWARLSDRTGKRKAVLALLSALSALTVWAYYAGTGYSVVLIATIAFASFFSALLPLCDALVIEGCSERGIEFARIRMGGTLGYAFVVFVIGMYLEGHPEVQFVIVSLLCIAFLGAIVLLPAKPGAPHSQDRGAEASCASAACSDKQRISQRSVRPIFGVFRTREVIYVLLFALVSQIGLGFAGSFLGRYVVELGYGQGLVGTLSMISALSELPILLFADAIVRRFGEVKLLIASCFFMVVRVVLIGLGVIPSMVAGQLMQSITYMTVYYSCTQYVSKEALSGHQSQAQGILVMVQSGVAMLVANLAGGVIGDAFGMRAAFFLIAGLVLAGTLVVLCAYRMSGVDRQSMATG